MAVSKKSLTENAPAAKTTPTKSEKAPATNGVAPTKMKTTFVRTIN